MNEKASAYVIFGDGTRIHVDVAQTEAARSRGLMFRPPLSDEAGMLFVFDTPGRYAFWMKNVVAPLDIIWLDEASLVVWIVEAAPPCHADPCPVYEPPEDASMVVEVPGGFARRHQVALGDAVSIRLPRSSSSRRPRRDRC